MKRIITVVCFFMCSTLLGQNYNVNQIPDSLKENASVVKRLEEYHVIIKSLDKVIIKHRYVLTILNENGDDHAEYSNNYSSWEGLSDISGNLYDAAGTRIKSVKRRDIADVASSDGVSLMLDDRIKTHNFHHRQYPYTIEYEDEQVRKGTYFLPSWFPVEDDEFAVAQSRYIIEAPAGYKLRYKQLNLLQPPVIAPNASLTSYTWELKNFKALLYEKYRPGFGSIVPMVYVGPDDFSFGGYNGKMDSWLSFGKFNVALNKDRDILPDNIKAEVHKLVDGIADKEEKAKVLYDYLQKNTRYIGVQLGIGGWQPFDAKYVAANKYGDCKALSNYMVSLLKEAGIKAHYVLVSAGERYRRLQEDFPISYFDHIITCVPTGKDTLWLECTDQTKSAGFMGSFTGGRKVLLIDEDGGHIVNTPVYNANDNLAVRKINAIIDENGNLAADVNTHFTGLQQELQHSLIHDATKEQRDKYLNQALNLPTYEVDRSEYKEIRGKIPVINEYLHVKAPNYATVSGKRLFILPNLFNKSATKLEEVTGRKFPIEFSAAFHDVDSIRISIPPGYTLEALPKDVSVDTRFGKFDMRYQVNGNSIEVIRVQERNRQTFPAEDYPLLVKYFDTLYKADHSRIVFVKKEG